MYESRKTSTFVYSTIIEIGLDSPLAPRKSSQTRYRKYTNFMHVWMLSLANKIGHRIFDIHPRHIHRDMCLLDRSANEEQQESEKNAFMCVCVMFDLTWEQNTSIGMLKIDIYRFLLNRICWRMLKLIALRFCQCLLFQAGEKFAY